MSKIKKRWSADEELVLCSMRKNNCSYKDIAKALNRTERSISNKVSKFLNQCKLEKTKISYKRQQAPNSEVAKIDYLEVAKRVAAGFGNIQAVLRQYSKETGISIHTLNNAYYNPSQSRTRIKDLVVMFMAVGQGGALPANCKNTNEKPKKSNIWTKLISWLPKSLLS